MARDISKSYGGVKACREVDFTVHAVGADWPGVTNFEQYHEYVRHLAGTVADGVVCSIMSSPAHVRRVCETAAAAQ